MLTSKRMAKKGDQVLVFKSGGAGTLGSSGQLVELKDAPMSGLLRDAADHLAENDGQFVIVGHDGSVPLFDALTPEQREELFVDVWAEWPAKTA